MKSPALGLLILASIIARSGDAASPESIALKVAPGLWRRKSVRVAMVMARGRR